MNRIYDALKRIDAEQSLDRNIQQEADSLLIDAKIRRLRQRGSPTPRSVSEPSGLSKALLHHNEKRNTLSPIATRARVDRALGATIGFFREHLKPEKRLSLAPRNKRRPLENPYNQADDSRQPHEGLSTPMTSRRMACFWMGFQPRKTATIALRQHIEKALFCIAEGEIEFQGAGRKPNFPPGYRLYFDAALPCAAQSLSNRKTSAIAAIRSPDE